MIDPRQVSVPSQGKNSVELRRGLALPSPYSSFPSPCGERVLLNLVVFSQHSSAVATFRFPSPCGERVLLNQGYMRAQEIDAGLGFRPLVGKGFC